MEAASLVFSFQGRGRSDQQALGRACVVDSCRQMKTFCASKILQFPGVIRVAGEEEDLVVFREGSDGLDGGGVENAKAHEEGDGTGLSLLKNLMEI
jgi:hypothetical protein